MLYEVITVNPTDGQMRVDLGAEEYCDVDNNMVGGSARRAARRFSARSPRLVPSAR